MSVSAAPNEGGPDRAGDGAGDRAGDAGGPADADAGARAERVLVLTPSGRDAEVACTLLARAGVAAHACAHVNVVAEELRRGAGAILIAEEAIAYEHAGALTRAVADQEAWSDVPIIVITLPGSRAGDDTGRAYAMLGASGNVTLIERPFRAATLTSAAQVALRSRRRQYEIRDLLADVRRGEEQLRLAVRTGRLGVWRVDLASRAIDASDICKAQYGQPANRPFADAALWLAIHPDDRDTVRRAADAAVGGDGAYELEYRVIWPADASTHWLLVRGTVTRDAAGRPLALGGVSLDITDRKVAEERREQNLEAERAARAEAERLGRMKDEFLATLSHELRTPLNAILGWAQLLNRGDDKLRPEQRHKALETIERNARIQAEMIEDLLDMSRIISGKLRLQPTPVDLATAVTAAVATVSTAAAAKGVRLETRLDPTVGRIQADANRLQQVVWNLLNNAVKFTPPGGVVRAELCRAEGDAVIRVTDTGRGIDPEFLPYVFERFRQADGSITRSFGGLGLGLAIVKQLVELHGGTVSVASAGHGRGATFSVTLPHRTASPDASGASRASEAPHGDANAHAGNAGDVDGANGMDVRLDDVRVLLVDDDADGLVLVDRILSECGARVTAVASAADAIGRVREGPFDVLVSDIGMPGQDGYALIAQVRQATAARYLPAVALTAFARDADRAHALGAGFDAHVAKPVEPGNLVNLVKALAMAHAPDVEAHAAAAGTEGNDQDEGGSTISTEPEPSDAPAGQRPMGVLIVDDTPVVADVLAQIFDSLGASATIAHSGQAAIELLTRAAAPRFDVIVSDISMPGMNGHELGERLRAMREAGTIRPKLLVAMSGYSEPAEKERSLRSGFDRHIVKPPEMHELERLLDDVRNSA